MLNVKTKLYPKTTAVSKMIFWYFRRRMHEEATNDVQEQTSDDQQSASPVSSLAYTPPYFQRYISKTP